jgi:hypothetical protein
MRELGEEFCEESVVASGLLELSFHGAFRGFEPPPLRAVLERSALGKEDLPGDKLREAFQRGRIWKHIQGLLSRRWSPEVLGAWIA